MLSPAVALTHAPGVQKQGRGYMVEVASGGNLHKSCCNGGTGRRELIYSSLLGARSLSPAGDLPAVACEQLDAKSSSALAGWKPGSLTESLGSSGLWHRSLGPRSHGLEEPQHGSHDGHEGGVKGGVTSLSGLLTAVVAVAPVSVTSLGWPCAVMGRPSSGPGPSVLASACLFPCR